MFRKVVRCCSIIKYLCRHAVLHFVWGEIKANNIVFMSTTIKGPAIILLEFQNILRSFIINLKFIVFNILLIDMVKT